MKFNNETIRTAVEEWLDDSKSAEKKYGHISNWNVSNVTDMSRMFDFNEKFNQDIGSWDVSNVTDMSNMFHKAEKFNQDIGSWDVSNVINMSEMFLWAESFNKDIGSWDVSNVNNMSGMFESAKKFNQDIGNWDVSNVHNMTDMFFSAVKFNQDIGNWDVSNVTDMSNMFNSTEKFNQDIGNWDVSKVNNMRGMFANTEKFNKDIGNWDVSNVTDMEMMFKNANSFNQDINKWNVDKVTNMKELFSEFMGKSIKRKNDNYRWYTVEKNEENEEKVKEVSFKISAKFTNELKKYVKSHNDNAVIYVYPSKYGVCEEFIHEGQWENKNFTMKISIPLKSPDFEFEGSLLDFIEQIGTKKINQLDNTNLNIALLGDGGGSWQIDEIIWKEKLSNEEKKKFNERDILKKWLYEGMESVEDEMVFEKGCIEEIKVTIGNKIIKLLK